jgi:cytochrome c peroxidase
MMSARIATSALALAACAVEPPGAATWSWELPPGFAAPRVPADNPMSAAKVELGRHLFYDTRLSGSGTQACASCHVQAHAFATGDAVESGSTGALGRRNAMPLANVAYYQAYTWADPALDTLEEQALVPMLGTSPVELGVAGREAEVLARLAADPGYAALFAEAFVEDAAPITLANVARGLASFQRTIVSGRSRFDRWLAGDPDALSEAERRGLALFESERLACARCHGGFAFTTATDGARYFNIGLYERAPARDAGLVEHTGDPAHAGRYRPPSLRNVSVTGPYMHDGSVATLGEVIDIYARGGRLVTDGPDAGDGARAATKSPLITGFPLAEDERSDLLAFLAALTDEALLADPALADPWR